jgi:hypothetical protein
VFTEVFQNNNQSLICSFLDHSFIKKLFPCLLSIPNNNKYIVIKSEKVKKTNAKSPKNPPKSKDKNYRLVTLLMDKVFGLPTPSWWAK